MKKLMILILTFLGIDSFAKKDGKFTLTEDQLHQLKAEFGEKWTQDFSKALSEYEEEKAGASSSDELNQAKADLTAAQDSLSSLQADKDALASEKSSLEQKIESLQNQVNLLSDLPVFETNSKPTTVKEDHKNEQFLFGQNVPFMAIDDRHPYNRRAYASVMSRREGMEFPTPKYASIDYSSLEDDLGQLYRIRKQERIQSFLLQLPSLETIFPLESGYQDRAVLVNMFLNEFSQADNTIQSDFDDVVKGGYKFEPEELRMFDVMFSYKFRDLKQLEKQWIGYLNREGSNTMKWSFIEFIMVETGKALHNEREIRRISGRRIDPTTGVAGMAINASDGLREFIKKKIAAFQLRPFALGEWTSSNISDYVRQATALVPTVVRDTGKLVLYMSPDAVSAYHKNNEFLYGVNQDYKADLMYVKEYPNVKIVAVPNMAESKRMIWTLEGNIALFEDQAGEMYNFYFEQQDWTLKVWSNWKESIWAYMVGRKYENLAQIPSDYSTQLIFCNDVDYPSDYYLPMVADDATPSVAVHNCLVSVANSDSLALTGIDDCAVGQEVKIKCGNTDEDFTIAKSGVFSLLTDAWDPEVGDVLTLRKRSDGKFIEVKREDALSAIPMFTLADATPDVSESTSWITNPANDGVNITNLDAAVEETVYTLYGITSDNGKAGTSIANSGNFVLTDAFAFGAGTSLTLVKSATNGKFYELSRT